MLDPERILHAFSLFSDLTGEALEPWRSLCEGAGARLEKRLRPQVTQPDAVDMERLCTAAAALAYGNWLMMQADAAVSSDEVRVGDITLRDAHSSSRRDARDIGEYFLEQAADLLLPGHQALLQVAS